MTIISYAMPIMRGRPQGNPMAAQRLERFAFWVMCLSMLGITLALTVAGSWQVALQRLPESGEALSFMATQERLEPVFWARLGFGVVFLLGLVAYLSSFFVGAFEEEGETQGLEGAQPRAFATRRGLIQRIAGTHRRFAVSWQDDRSVRLPTVIACFPDPQLNQNLYFWLTALAAKQSAQPPSVKHWFAANQQSCLALLARRPGLRQTYAELVAALIAQRPTLAHEAAIQQALRQPGSVPHVPLAAGDPLPVPLWLYPAPLRLVAAASAGRAR